ncbi:dGTP triphosphohydrolase [Bacillus manliponensis]|uniref:dGTP triphosphohydrolase n=1 Tax=Bacillus manliponensis TaxID=574376 RepID=A0A073K488_9BACI|nr:diguanylate cyclase [Bacillus manliponensis]KEK21386.1 dGTP triphosphohydrolase [Bacillus manliponensis]
MKKTYNKALSLWILQILFYFSTVHMTAYKYALTFTIAYVLVNILFLFLQDKHAFVLFVIGMIISVFYLFYEAWIYLWSSPDQLYYMIVHFLMSSNFFLIYISTYMLKQLVRENMELSKRVDVLEQYIGESKILTKQEFQRRQALLEKAMRRREETGMILYFDFTSFSNYTKKSVMDRVASLLLDTVRQDFDLVGKYDNNKLVVFLQNTNEEGASIVMNRLKPKLKQWLTEDATTQITIEKEQIGTKESSAL